jgi:hypothetical protein
VEGSAKVDHAQEVPQLIKELSDINVSLFLIKINLHNSTELFLSLFFL